MTPQDLFRAELNERLVVHWTGGSWRVPLGTRHRDLADAQGARLGRIVCADRADVARARARLAGGAGADPAALDRALAPLADLLARVRAWEGVPGDGWDPGLAAQTPGGGSGAGPVVILSAAATPIARVLGLVAQAAARGGAVWKPAPGAAASAHLALRALGPVWGPAVALLQGDHATGQALLADGLRPVWA